MFWLKGNVIVKLLILPCRVRSNTAHSSTAKFTQQYNTFLAKYWHASEKINGIDTTVFEYERMANDSNSPDSLMSQIEDILTATETRHFSGDTAKAFWMNVYNYATMRPPIN